MDRAAAEAALLKLAVQFEGAWKKQRAKAFAGAVMFETENTTYRFLDGVFVGRAPRKRTGFPVWETPSWMKDVELLGFLYEEKGRWSMSPRWREDSLAVITTNARSLMLTSPTVDFDQHEPTIPTVPSFNVSLRRSA